ncbi:Protease 3 precursor [Clostridium sp. N3C]|uniref:M16 family metallopeptidase n=1 Tax=Clostridium sp. N3C TaxID=1776758 RepID=UPI00092E0B77|nr:pitrilysin family protein [Clostridium sp. N3C]SCN21412.1 Protease 3 precursor [Clostridium sp. N3C]
MEYNFFDARDTRLDNGLRIITVKRNTSIASLQCGIKIGALYEGPEERGISHFIEHMLFKGTKNRSNQVLNQELEFLGGEYNAYTDYTNTVYSITVLEEEIKNAAALLADMLINSTFPEDEIIKEKGVILAEYNSISDDIEDYSFRMTNYYGFKESPLKYDVIGTAETISNFTRKQLRDFYYKNYVPNNCVITLVSSMEHELAIEMMKEQFGHWKSNIIDRLNPIIEKNINIKKTTYKSNIEQSTITYLYTFYNLDKKKELALRILNHRLGESTNSILFRELREKRGLAYDVYTHLDTTREIKTLYIYTAVQESLIKETIDVINNCIDQIKMGSMVNDDDMFVLIKKVMKTSVASTLEDSTDLANYILHQCLDGESIYEFIDDMKNIDNLHKEEIYMVAKEVFNNPTIHILKPKK